MFQFQSTSEGSKPLEPIDDQDDPSARDSNRGLAANLFTNAIQQTQNGFFKSPNFSGKSDEIPAAAYDWFRSQQLREVKLPWSIENWILDRADCCQF